MGRLLLARRAGRRQSSSAFASSGVGGSRRIGLEREDPDAELAGDIDELTVGDRPLADPKLHGRPERTPEVEDLTGPELQQAPDRDPQVTDRDRDLDRGVVSE